MLINDAAVAAVEGVFLYTKGVSVPRNLTRDRIHHSVKHIPAGPFHGCTALVVVELHEGLCSIGMKAFYECSLLLRIIIPPSVYYINGYAFQECINLVEVELRKGLSSIGQWAFGSCSSLLRIIIPSSVSNIGNDAYGSCGLLRNVTISSTSAITQEQFASSFPTLHDKEITLDLIKGRFDELSLHRLSININPKQGTQEAEVQARCESFIQVVNQYPVKEFQHRDCLGMTPLHVILCSGIDSSMRVIQCLIEKCPDAMLIQDKWGEVPLDYALLGNASIAVISLLFMTHSKRWEDMPFDFGNMIQRLARMNKPAQFVRDVIRVQRTHFPSLVVDWQHIVAQSFSQYDEDRILIGTFRVFVEASISVRLYNCMSEDNRIEVDARIHEIEEDNDQYIDAIHYFGVIRNMVTKFVHLHQELLQEAGNTLVQADMPTDAIKHVLSFL